MCKDQSGNTSNIHTFNPLKIVGSRRNMERSLESGAEVPRGPRTFERLRNRSKKHHVHMTQQRSEETSKETELREEMIFAAGDLTVPPYDQERRHKRIKRRGKRQIHLSSSDFDFGKHACTFRLADQQIKTAGRKQNQLQISIRH